MCVKRGFNIFCCIINMLSDSTPLSLVTCISSRTHTSFLHFFVAVSEQTTASNHTTLPTTSCFLWQTYLVSVCHSPPVLAEHLHTMVYRYFPLKTSAVTTVTYIWLYHICLARFPVFLDGLLPEE